VKETDMTLKDFRNSLKQSTLPKGISELLKALWYDGRGDWNTAHAIAQEIYTSDGSWVHAYLHRKEGDIANASYWYQKAGKPRPNHSLEEEWQQLAEIFLKE
jgi:hypothetical protein